MKCLVRITGLIVLVIITGNYPLNSVRADSFHKNTFLRHYDSDKHFVNVHFDGTSRHLRISSIYQDVIVEIYAIDGTLVQLYRLKDTRTGEFDLSHLKNGIYLIKFISEDKVQIEKVVISD
jgi:hypothetical protein